MASVQLSNIERKMRYFIQHYNPHKYWKYRNDVIRYTGGTSIAKIVCEMKLLYIKTLRCVQQRIARNAYRIWCRVSWYTNIPTRIIWYYH